MFATVKKITAITLAGSGSSGVLVENKAYQFTKQKSLHTWDLMVCILTIIWQMRLTTSV